jgi:hypothetical protein
MQVDFHTHSQNAFQSVASKLTEDEKQFIKQNYAKTNGGFFNLYSFQIDKNDFGKMVDTLLRKGVGTYSARLGHSIQPQLINAL